MRPGLTRYSVKKVFAPDFVAAGVVFRFGDADERSLAPGQRVLVVHDVDVFRFL